jgi:hypothetical protein
MLSVEPMMRADSIIEGTPVNKNEGLWMGAV